MAADAFASNERDPLSLYLCDTDWMIDLLADRSAARHLLLPLTKAGLSLSMISLGELYDGVVHGRDPIAAERQLDRILAFIPAVGIDQETMRLFGGASRPATNGRESHTG